MSSPSSNEPPDEDDARIDVFAAYKSPEGTVFVAEIADGPAITPLAQVPH